MVVTIYGISNSPTRKAIKWFKVNHIPYVYRDIEVHPLTINEMKKVLALTENGTTDVLAVRSHIYNQLSEKIEKMSLQKLLYYMKRYPSLLRKPLIFNEQKLQVGFNDSIRQFIPKEKRQDNLLQLLLINPNPQIEGV